MFRWFRITLLLILFLVVAGVTYLRLAGLPDFLKRPLLRRLMAEGVAAQFGNMQLGWARGPSIVIENAAFSRSHQPLSPRLSASRAELALSWDALLHCQIELDSLQVSSAQLQFPVSETNGDTLLLTNVALDMRFYSNDVVRINDCRGTFRGLEMDLIGGVSHASDMLHWKLPSSGGSDAFQTRLRQLARTVEKIHLSGRPLLRIDAGVDGRDPNSFKAGLNFAAPTALTPWGDVTNLVMEAACARLADSSNQPILQVKWSAANLATPWARGGKVSFSTILSRGATSNFDAEIRMEAARFNATLDSSGSNWFAASRLSWNGTATLAYSNFLPLLATGTLRAVEPQTAWGSADEMFMECRATRAQDQPPPEASWGSWTRIAPWTLDWRAELRNITSPKLRFDHLAFSGRWHAPQVVIENLQGELYGGQVNAGAILDIASRELHCDGVTDFDPHSISQLFKPAAQNWMAQYEWTAPPMVNAQLRVVLPPWTNRRTGPPPWRPASRSREISPWDPLPSAACRFFREARMSLIQIESGTCPICMRSGPMAIATWIIRAVRKATAMSLTAVWIPGMPFRYSRPGSSMSWTKCHSRNRLIFTPKFRGAGVNRSAWVLLPPFGPRISSPAANPCGPATPLSITQICS